MEAKFTQHEFESRAYKILDYGDETKIAERVNKGSSIISQMYNPDDERESNLFKAAMEIVALKDISFERGCKMLRFFNEMVERGNPAERKCVQKESKKFNQELREFYDTEMCGESLETQIAELSDVEAAARELRKAKEQELEKSEIKTAYILGGNGVKAVGK